MKIRNKCSFVFGKTTVAALRMHKRWQLSSQVAFLFSILSRIVELNRARRQFAFFTSNHRRMYDSLRTGTSFCCWVDNAFCGVLFAAAKEFIQTIRRRKKLAVGFPKHIYSYYTLMRFILTQFKWKMAIFVVRSRWCESKHHLNLITSFWFEHIFLCANEWMSTNFLIKLPSA